MAKTKKKSAETIEDIDLQSEEGRETVLKRAVQGRSTATGQAAYLHSDEYEEPEESENENRTQVGDEPTGDFGDAKADNPSGLQTEEATYTVNGTVNPMFVATPSGPQPIGAFGEQGLERLKEQHKMADKIEKEIAEAKKAGKGLDKPITLVNADGETRESTNREWRDNRRELQAAGWTRPEDDEPEAEEPAE
jgi:hypothetical protein